MEPVKTFEIIQDGSLRTIAIKRDRC